MSSKVFEPVNIGRERIGNRLLMAPLTSNYADEGNFVTPEIIDFYERRARGGIGAIIVEATAVNERKTHSPRCLGIYDDKFIDGLKKLSESIKRWTKAFIQLNDAIVALGRKPEDLSLEEIYEIRDDFIKGAVRAHKAGFDGIELHMAHRYTLADFLSKRANRRKDDFGGGIRGRLKLPLMIIKGIREELGDFPLIVRINGEDFTGGGNSIIDTKKVAKTLEQWVDAIHVSAGGRIEEGGDRSYSCFRSVPVMGMPDALNAPLAEEIKRVVRVPVITVGKIGKPKIIEKIIGEGKADLVALGRPLLRDPDFPSKMMKSEKIKLCVYCNNCMRAFIKGDVLRCRRAK